MDIFRNIIIAEYCQSCKHSGKDEIDEPCRICLENPINQKTRVPLKWDEKRTCLNDVLKSIDTEKLVAIGTYDGHGLIYIGENDEFKLNLVFDDIITARQITLSKYKAHLATISNPTAQLPNEPIARERIIKSRKSRIRRLKSLIRKHSIYCQTFTPFMNREALQIYHRDFDGAIVIIITGEERGSFWFRTEFDKKYSERRLNELSQYYISRSK